MQEGVPKFKDKPHLCHPEPLFGEGSPPLRDGILPYAQNDIVFLMLSTSDKKHWAGTP